jgi:hypothetical protein
MTTVNADVDTLASEPSDILTLTTGERVQVERLKTRQTMSLLKILTRGFGGALSSLFVAEDTDSDEFAAELLGSMLVSIPEAEEETIDFIKKMVSPADLIEDPRTKAEKGSNAEAIDRLTKALDNPELDDLFAIVEVIIRTEAPHIQQLGKRLAVLFKVQTLSETAKSKNS